MESFGAFLEGDNPWEPEFMQYSTVFPVDDNEFFNISSFCSVPQIPNMSFINGDSTTLFGSMNSTASGLSSGSEESSYGSYCTDIVQNNFTAHNHVAVTNDVPDSVYSMDFVGFDEKNKSILCVVPEMIMEDTGCAEEDLGGKKIAGANLVDSQPPYDAVLANQLQLKQKFSPEIHPVTRNGIVSAESTKKRTRVSGHAEESGKSDKRKKKYQKVSQNRSSYEESINGGLHGQSSSGCSSEDENTSEAKATSSAANVNGKTRASRGTATDPQSLYARKRRERINERLKILQNLVPNGTKVDISTMLEEAVHYVKFLQLQIKLLSSDDLWMYAPIAYNGIDIGLHQKISLL